MLLESLNIPLSTINFCHKDNTEKKYQCQRLLKTCGPTLRKNKCEIKASKIKEIVR